MPILEKGFSGINRENFTRRERLCWWQSQHYFILTFFLCKLVKQARFAHTHISYDDVLEYVTVIIRPCRHLQYISLYDSPILWISLHTQTVTTKIVLVYWWQRTVTIQLSICAKTTQLSHIYTVNYTILLINVWK